MISPGDREEDVGDDANVKNPLRCSMERFVCSLWLRSEIWGEQNKARPAQLKGECELWEIRMNLIGRDGDEFLFTSQLR